MLRRRYVSLIVILCIVSVATAAYAISSHDGTYQDVTAYSLIPVEDPNTGLKIFVPFAFSFRQFLSLDYSLAGTVMTVTASYNDGIMEDYLAAGVNWGVIPYSVPFVKTKIFSLIVNLIFPIDIY